MGTKSNQSLVIGLGAMWGIVEATLGWGLHLLHVPFRSLLLFPIGLFFMLLGVDRVGDARVAIRIAAVAALIKLSNLLMPGVFPAYYVVNPAVAIWLEGMAIFAFSYFFLTRPQVKKANLAYSFLGGLGFVVLMQIAFSGWQFIVSGLNVTNPALVREFSVGNILPFTLQSLLKGGFLIAIVHLLKRREERSWELRFNWFWAASLVVIGLIVNYVTL